MVVVMPMPCVHMMQQQMHANALVKLVTPTLALIPMSHAQVNFLDSNDKKLTNHLQLCFSYPLQTAVR